MNIRLTNRCKKCFSILMIMVVVVSSIMLPEKIYAANQYVTPIKMYAISPYNNTPVYNWYGTKIGTIYGSDLCTITQVCSDNRLKVTYPIARGTKTGYVNVSSFFADPNYTISKVRVTSNTTVYRRAGSSQTIGTTFTTDTIYKVGERGSYAQIIYNISGGYKSGWILKSRIKTTSNNVNSNAVTVANGYYMIASAINSNYVVDINNVSMDNCAKVCLYQKNNQNNQKFYISHVRNGFYKIQAVHSGKVLDIYDNRTQAGTPIIQYTWNGGNNQLWKIIKNADGTYTFRSGLGTCLDAYGAIAGNNVKICSYTPNGTIAQKFYLQGTSIDGNESINRQRAVDYMNKMATVKWTPSKTFLHWSGGRYWYAGTVYTGIPYTQKARTCDLEKFKSNMSGNKYVGPSGQTTYLGNDCSSAVSMAYRKVYSSFPITWTGGMFPKESYIKQVGSYNAGKSTDAKSICSSNGINVMKRAYACLQKGDIVLCNTHVMMVTAQYGDAVAVTHQTTYDYGLRSTWRVNERYSYTSLYNGGYIPVTLSKWT